MKLNLNIGIDIARPHPGACSYMHADVYVLHRELTSRLTGNKTNKTAAALIMTSSSSDARAAEALTRINELIAPQMEFGRHALEIFTHELSEMETTLMPMDAAIAWTDGTRVRVACRGHHRIVLLRNSQAEMIPPPEGRAFGWSDVEISVGDWFIMAAPSTDAAMPLGSILALAQKGLDANKVCKTATSEASRGDPLNHHAVLAIHIVQAD